MAKCVIKTLILSKYSLCSAVRTVLSGQFNSLGSKNEGCGL